MKNTNFLFTTILTSIFIASCGGGGGGGGESASPAPPPTPSPTTSISADPTTVYVGNSTTLTWSSTDSTSCTASGDWEGSKSSSGNEDVQITKEGLSTFTITCSNSSGSSSSSAEVTGENLYSYADWDSHSLIIDNIQTRHQPYNTKINLEEAWYKTLSIPESDFTTTVDTYTFEELQSGGIGYGSHLALSDRTYVFHSNWEGFNEPENGRAAALIYDNARNLTDFVYKKIPGGTHQYPLLNLDGTYQVLFPGVDEGEIKDGKPGDATSWVFNTSDNTFTEVPINVGCHGSNKFDYEQDGDEDVICQSWGGEFNGKPIIFKNNGLLNFEAVEVESNGVPGHFSASAFYDDDFLNIIYTDAHGVGSIYNVADFTNVIVRYLSTDLSNIVDVVELSKAFFEINRVAKKSYIWVESYRNEVELCNLQCWAFTCKSFYDPSSWKWIFKKTQQLTHHLYDDPVRNAFGKEFFSTRVDRLKGLGKAFFKVFKSFHLRMWHIGSITIPVKAAENHIGRI